ncbi:SDR family oxidoreductase [Deinococcus cellulosilyticus]|uniref:NAD(P)-dependent oxidoreductase n=1 Tax=Deinococcus cellulosilyticus (strain DSM 18568 / NBRC 106333 / KACC 11606 / 5516J-15) TaxID=1223518 RepID=A0A511MZS5_DEIC1|nr:SDR family oxidoreductase [Deinococcus cellulosilyticus]GEM46093.1 NAD(P)-dependent oxidoreductase [Deinococcus cellulosilyticus NBRC 106333 = KACC 11606]
MILVTAATGQLGKLTIKALLEAGTEPSRIIAGVRNPEKAQGLKALGVQVRPLDYSQPETIKSALQGVERLLLISGTNFGQRVQEHQNVIEAAKKADVKLLAYTSILNAGEMMLAGEHKGTEAVLKASGVPYVLLRNGWYNENYLSSIQQAAATGKVFGAAGEGRISSAARSEYAEAAAQVLLTDGHENQTYELGGSNNFTLAELAAEIAHQTGKEVSYHNLPAQEYEALLVQFGLPAGYAHALADSDTGIARGELFTERDDLTRLIGHATTPISETVRQALEVVPQS